MITDSDINACYTTVRRIAAKFNIPGYDTDDLTQEGMLKLAQAAATANATGLLVLDWPHYAARVVKRRIMDIRRDRKTELRNVPCYGEGLVSPTQQSRAERGAGRTFDTEKSFIRQPWLTNSASVRTTADPEPSAVDGLIAAEEAELLHEAISHLPDEWRQPLELHMAGFGLVDIAKMLGGKVSHMTIKRYLEHAKSHIRRFLTLKGVR